jgi:hypothetical protein
MNQSSNVEKQARYRKKEMLKRRADQILLKWRLEPWKHHLKSMEEIHHLVEAAIRLPPRWTDEDYSNAEIKLHHVYIEVISPVNQLSNDLRESRNIHEAAVQPHELPDLNANFKKALDNTNALASHIISALKLSACTEADQAAALVEAMRFVGRILTNNREVPCSQATAMCLATIGPIYARPAWFTEKFAKTLSQQIHPKLLTEIGSYLTR